MAGYRPSGQSPEVINTELPIARTKSATKTGGIKPILAPRLGSKKVYFFTSLALRR